MKNSQSVSLQRVSIQGGFWKDKQRLVAATVIPYQWKALNDEIADAEPSHSIENFRIAAGETSGEYYGFVFQDSDVGKWIEAAAYSLLAYPDPALEEKIDSLISIIAKAQEPDGYLETYFSVKSPEKRWTDFAMGHEMYSGGHLMEGAVAYFETTGKRQFLDIMVRYADHLCAKFGRGPGQIIAYDGHPEIELALHRLANATGVQKYRALANFFVDERGKHPEVLDNDKVLAWHPETTRWNKRDYYQDHLPVREQFTAEGHSVRAMYLYIAMTEQRRHENDQTLDKALFALWNNVVDHRMYVTGGLGSHASYERFTIDDDLPSDTSYTETCAAIGLVLWAWRMTLLDCDARYADVLERAIFNGAMAGISADGTRYFYVNPLEVVPGLVRARKDLDHVKTQRVEWFGCACCPPNIARTIASFGRYLYSSNESTLWVHQYAESLSDLAVGNGSFTLKQTTNYPWEGRVEIRLAAVPADGQPRTVAVRIPSWCGNASLTVNGEPASFIVEKGYRYVTKTWSADDVVVLDLSMPVQFVRSHPRVRETLGKVAVQRGPIVYCAEEADNGPALFQLFLDTDSRPQIEVGDEKLPRHVRLRAAARRVDTQPAQEQFSTAKPGSESCDVVLVPYHLWGNRGEGEMTVWLNEARPFEAPRS